MTSLEDAAHAYNWATQAQQTWLSNSHVTILEISTSRLEAAKLVRSDELYETLGVAQNIIQHRVLERGVGEAARARSGWLGEWQHLGAIDGEAVVREWSLEGEPQTSQILLPSLTN